jgi:hypothetical protein
MISSKNNHLRGFDSGPCIAAPTRIPKRKIFQTPQSARRLGQLAIAISRPCDSGGIWAGSGVQKGLKFGQSGKGHRFSSIDLGLGIVYPCEAMENQNENAQGLFDPRDISRALGLLSRLPVRPDGQRGAQSVWAFPIVGLIVALIVGSGAALGLAMGLAPALAAGLALFLQIMITGAMHEDGLADTFDGLWGGWEAERRLEIMKDSRIGAYGVIALNLSLVMRCAAGRGGDAFARTDGCDDAFDGERAQQGIGGKPRAARAANGAFDLWHWADWRAVLCGPWRGDRGGGALCFGGGRAWGDCADQDRRANGRYFGREPADLRDCRAERSGEHGLAQRKTAAPLG